MTRILAVFFIFSSLYSCKNNSSEIIRTISWVGSNHTLFDTAVLSDDHPQAPDHVLHIAFQIVVSDTGCRFMKRDDYDSPMRFYAFHVADSLKELIFNLASDSTVLNFRPAEEVQTYCGLNYLLSISKKDFSRDINYIPPRENNKLRMLHEVFDSLRKSPLAGTPVEVDTTALGSLIFERVKGFNPTPPLKSAIKYQPPVITDITD